MKAQKMRQWVTMVMALLVLGVVLGACGAESPTGSTVQTTPGFVTEGTGTQYVVGMKTCVSCHPNTTADWMLTRHANVEPIGNLNSKGVPTIGQITGCTTNCHDPLGDSRQLIASFTGNTVRPVVGCESCHSGGSLHAAAGGVQPIGFATTTAMVIGTTSTLQASAQFRTCTGCHELLDPVDPAGTLATTATHSTLVPTGDANVITDTHFAKTCLWTAGTSTNENTIDISGYAMDYSSETVCTNCHNPHKTADINREWASSRHAIKTADRAWAHYNWSCDGTVSATCGTGSTGSPTNRRSCQRCHTTTGATTYANARRDGNAALADSIIAGTYVIPNFFSLTWKPEMLQCTACHTDNREGLRDPGAFRAAYGGSAGAVSHQYDDLAGSNICMPCHTGRKAGSYINLVKTKFKTGFAMRDVETHYLPAAGTMFKSIGYEYAGRDYDNPTAFIHDKIGTSALSIDGGGSGPCVGCHMYRPGGSPSHLFKALNVSGGIITGITSDVCFNVACHPGSNSMLTEIAETEKTQFEYALEVFAVALASKPSYTFKPYTTANNTADYIPLSNIESPYFGTVASSNVTWDNTDDTGNTEGKHNVGAAYNFLLLHDEPGAYVHNSKYTRRLIYDSIDWLDDGNLNYSVGATLPSLTYGPLTVLAKTKAAKYLLPFGSLWVGTYPAGYGIASERP